MDLHFNEATATPEERAAVDEVLGAPSTRWEGGDRVRETDGRFASAGRDAREQRHLLLPTLHAVQSRIGWISPGALNYVALRLTVPPAEAYGVASFYAMFALEETPGTVVHVCDDIACKTAGADGIVAELAATCGPEGEPCADGRATWKRSPCLGLCERAPAALFQTAGDRDDATVAPITADGIRAGMSGEAVGPERLRSPTQTGGSGPSLLRRVGVVDPGNLDDYRAHGGYEALRRAIALGPDGVVREVSDSKLVGRGGAAFPTGVKWTAVAHAAVQPHLVVCNADESEPGTFKDRVIMEEDPFSVIESLTIAGFATGSARGYLYIRGEYPEAHGRLAAAADVARSRGFLGEAVMGQEGFDFDIEIRRGAGAYICGEETALFNSIEGYRGEPRNKPPFPVSEGLFGKPTAINNVETLINVLEILRDGGPVFAGRGTEGSTGTKLFCVSGCVAQPGLFEVPFGTTLRDLLGIAGGVRDGRALQAILLGGAAGSFVTPDQLDVPLTFEGTRSIGASLGSGVVLVFDETIDMQEIVLRIARFFRDESCGQCVPCRVGTARQEEALLRIASGSDGSDVSLLAELETVMRDASICGLGQTAANAVRSAVQLGFFAGGG